jgi:NAD(P)-dependent dehydrogenase (short-subunit alcohol dehydrogenase family)
MVEILGPKTPVIVTGGASGVGRGACQALAEQGRPVAVWDIQEQLAQEVAAECRERYGVATHVQVVDLADEKALEAGVAATLAALGGVGGLAYCAGVNAWYESTYDVGGKGWEQVMGVNLRGAAVLMRLLIPALKANPGSAIVLCSSASTFDTGTWHDPAYLTSKTGLIGLSRAMAKGLGPDGIRVNVVTPGTVDTPLFRKGIENAGGSPERTAKTVPIGRLGEPIDLGRAIRFLLSNEASYVTGTNLVVDGGRTSAG